MPLVEDKIITQPDSVYFSFPRLRWSVCHLREFLPTEEISRGTGAPVPLDYPSPADFADLRAEIDAHFDTVLGRWHDKPVGFVVVGLALGLILAWALGTALPLYDPLL